MLAACGSDANVVRDVSGRVIGSAEQVDVPKAESLIFVPDGDWVIRSRRSRTLAGRYDEVVASATESVRYQAVYASGWSASSTQIGAIQSIVDTERFRSGGLTRPIRESELRTVTNPYGSFALEVIRAQ